MLQSGLYPTNCTFNLNMLGNGNHKITVIAFSEDKKLRVRSVDFEIARGNVIFAENFDGGWENDWEISYTNHDFTWQIQENSLESFSETNSNSTHSATSPVAYTNLNETMVSSEIQLSVADEWEWNFNVGFCDRYPSYPGITAAISNDSGNSWTDMWQTANTGLEEWTWKYVSLNISAYAGQSIMLKYTCSGFSYADVSIDGIRIIEPQEVHAQNNLIVPKIELSNYPNPFNPNTRITFDLPTEISKNTELEIYNLKGQRIKTFPINSSTHQPINSVTWNGTDENNQAVSSGIYFARLKTGNQAASKKMLLLK